MQLVTTLITWKGNNYIQIIQAFDSLNRELKVRVVGKRLIVRDTEAKFYRVFSLDDIIEIPVGSCEEDDPIEQPTLTLPSPRSEGKKEWSWGNEWGERVTLGDIHPELFNHEISN